MSDDARENIGQPTPIQRVQNQIDELTRERDLYKRMLERYEPDPTYSTPTEVDRLRAELDRHRVAGDEVLWELARVGPDLPESARERLLPKVAAWRAVRGAVWCEAAAEGDHDRNESGVCRECGR